MKFINTLSQRLLGLFLSDVTAGACVIEFGCCCGTSTSIRRIGCYGSCVSATSCRCNYPQ
jgi:hypothetical protein